MNFTDPAFLFLFLPLVLAVYYSSPRGAKNAVLLGASLVFYALGEGISTFVVLGSIAINFFMGWWIFKLLTSGSPDEKSRAIRSLILGVTINLCMLAVFKYARFLVENFDAVLGAFGVHELSLPKIYLPLGISFFTFHALSYITDVWRGQVKPMRKLSGFGLYIMLFPQLIAGPIIRYKTICDQFDIDGEKGRRHSWDLFAQGVQRFIIGFGKKMLVANTVARTADLIFSLRPGLITPGAAWLGVICYTIQIYFDFSGYSDMAIGLGRMFGFIFPENFDYPYISGSITEFWRRWHITLSTWFRDYLYIPMGGNRHGRRRTFLNLLIVFFLCGLWHGATWTFVAWGMFHGVFLIIERAGLGRVLERRTVLRHFYAMLVVMVGWVFFTADTFHGALQYLGRMAFLPDATQAIFTLRTSLDRAVMFALAAGVVGSVPAVPMISAAMDYASRAMRGWSGRVMELAVGLTEFAALALIFITSSSLSAAGTYNPFIYFRF